MRTATLNPAPCPPAGSGVHTWLLSRANQCRWSGMTPDAAARLLRDGSVNCGRPVHAREIREAICKAYAEPGIPARLLPHWLRPSTPRWPERNAAQIARIVQSAGLADLRAASSIQIEPDTPDAEGIVDQLFPGNPLVCVGRSSREFDTKPRDEWRGQLSNMQLLVPSPMTARTGLTKEGKVSAHALASTGQRRFLVVEFDTGSADAHAALLLHLAGFAPLVCAVHSGGKSLHGWFFVAGQPEDRVAAFFRYAVGIGADPALWTRSQFCRMPNGLRDNGRRQTVHFLNFRPLKGQP